MVSLAAASDAPADGPGPNPVASLRCARSAADGTRFPAVPRPVPRPVSPSSAPMPVARTSASA